MPIIAQEGGGGSYITFVIIGVFIAIFYFLLIRPGQKQKKAHQQLVTSLKKGDEVMTAGGFYGTVKKVDAETVMLEIASKTEIRLSKNSIARVITEEEEEEEYEEDEELEEEVYEEEGEEEEAGDPEEEEE